jgi:hypothetical protein
MCRPSALESGTPRSHRRVIAKAVSAIGSPSANRWHDDQHHGGALHRTMHGKHRQHETDEQAPRVSEEDPRGIEVVAEEPDQRTEQCRGGDGDLGITERERDGERGPERHDGNPCGEPVEPVDEVECVGHPHDPEYRNRKGEPAEVNGVGTDADRFDPETEGEDDHGTNDLKCQLHQWERARGDRRGDRPRKRRPLRPECRSESVAPGRPARRRSARMWQRRESPRETRSRPRRHPAAESDACERAGLRRYRRTIPAKPRTGRRTESRGSWREAPRPERKLVCTRQTLRLDRTDISRTCSVLPHSHVGGPTEDPGRTGRRAMNRAEQHG